MKRPTLVILSGGMDSTVLAHYVHNSPRLSLLGCVSVDYGQRHKYELTCAAATCKALGVPHHLINLSSLAKHIHSSALTGSEKVPEGHYAEASMKATVVPNRNMILISLAVAVGITNKAAHVAYGAHAGDHAVYPDCRPQFAEALANVVELCDYDPPTLLRPFIDITKAEIVSLGLKYNVPFERTWTCYKGRDNFLSRPIACGKCGTCVERLEAFDACGAVDPMEYEDREFWRTTVKNAPKTQNLPLC